MAPLTRRLTTSAEPATNVEGAAKMTSQPSYDYGRLGSLPKLLAFYAGWTVQRTAFLLHSALMSAWGRADHGLDMWRQAAAEMNRLVLLCDAWRLGTQDKSWPRSLRRALLEMASEATNDGGWWTKGEAEAARADAKTWEELPLEDVADGYDPFFPIVNVEKPELNRWIDGPILTKVARVAELLGELTECVDVLVCGVRLSGLFHCVALKDPRTLAEDTMSLLVRLEVATHDKNDLFFKVMPILPENLNGRFNPSPTRAAESRFVCLEGKKMAGFTPFSLSGCPPETVYWLDGWTDHLVMAALASVFRKSGVGTPPLEANVGDQAEVRQIRKHLERSRDFLDVPSEIENVLWYHGDVWTVRFHGGQARLFTNQKGMVELAYLLANPGTMFTATQLLVLRPPADTNLQRNSMDSDCQGQEELSPVNFRASMGPVVDDIALRQTRNQLRELREQQVQAEEEGNQEMALNLGERIQQLTRTLGAVVDAHGRVRHVKSPEWKSACDSIGTRIRRVLQQIQEKDRELWEHLEQEKALSRRNGEYCYRPATPVDWDITL